MGFKASDAKNSQYLGKDDFGDGAVVTIGEITRDQIKDNETGETKYKLVLHLDDCSNPTVDTEKSIILNLTNAEMIEHLTGTDDCDSWRGKKVEFFNDPTVRFGNSKGGLRVRQVQGPI